MIRIAVVGAGYWGPNLIRNTYKNPNIELVGICDKSQSALDKMHELYPSVPIFTDYDSMLSQAKLDGVIVATPAATHYNLAKKALEAGINVMVEKPLTLSSADAISLINLAKARDLNLMVGHTFLYSDNVHALKKVVREEIGRTLYGHSLRTSCGPVRKDVDVIWNVGPHDISIFNYLFDSKPLYVSMNGSFYLQQGVADVVAGKIRYPNNVDIYVHYSWLDPHRERKISIIGDEQMVSYDDTNQYQPIEVFDKSFNDGVVTQRNGSVITIKYHEPLYAEIDHFADCIRGGGSKLFTGKPFTDGQNALDVILVLEAMSESLAHGGEDVEVKYDR